MTEIANSAAGLLAERKEELKEPVKNLSKTMGSLIETLIAEGKGAALGGPDRTVLALRHLAADGSTADQSVLVDLPRLKSGESERLFKAAEFQASFERPPLTVEARLERGWIRATRLEGGRTEYDLFLVLKPLRAGAYESMQVVTRVEWPPAGPR
jgi:hypothetical protein